MALTRIVDDKMGVIWVNSATPVTLNSSTGIGTVFSYISSDLPSGVSLPSPWFIRYRITDAPVTTKNLDGPLEFLEMKLQGMSSDWVDIVNWNIMAYTGMSGRFQYDFNSGAYTRYRVLGRVFAKKDGTATAVSILMGMDNFAL